jgi:hypothetical protein
MHIHRNSDYLRGTHDARARGSTVVGIEVKAADPSWLKLVHTSEAPGRPGSGGSGCWYPAQPGSRRLPEGRCRAVRSSCRADASRMSVSDQIMDLSAQAEIRGVLVIPTWPLTGEERQPSWPATRQQGRPTRTMSALASQAASIERDHGRYPTTTSAAGALTSAPGSGGMLGFTTRDIWILCYL